MNKDIKLNSMQDANDLVEATCESEFDKIFVNSNNISVEARSILGLLNLIGKKNLKLVAPDHEDSDKFINLLNKIKHLI